MPYAMVGNNIHFISLAKILKILFKFTFFSGHTFCDNCITKKRMHFCPLCKVKASQFIPDYEMIDMISGNTSSTIIPLEKRLEDLELSEEIYVDKVENNNLVIIFFVNKTNFFQFCQKN